MIFAPEVENRAIYGTLYLGCYESLGYFGNKKKYMDFCNNLVFQLAAKVLFNILLNEEKQLLLVKRITKHMASLEKNPCK